MDRVPDARRSKAASRLAAIGVAWLLGASPASSQTADPDAIADAPSSLPAPQAALSGARLVAALRRGGYVVYFRHAATDHSRDDAAMRSFDDCAHQRPLSAQGRRDAEQVGARIRALALPLGETLASPFCRTLEIARLMLGRAEPRNAVREAQGGDYRALKGLLATPVEPGCNRWIVGHGIPFRAVAGPPLLAEGEAAVIEPHAKHWTVVARVSVGEWQALPAAP